jgi:hypothetical protein
MQNTMTKISKIQNPTDFLNKCVEVIKLKKMRVYKICSREPICKFKMNDGFAKNIDSKGILWQLTNSIKTRHYCVSTYKKKALSDGVLGSSYCKITQKLHNKSQIPLKCSSKCWFNSRSNLKKNCH